jgi:16S rRNA processing protein RimM
VNAGAQGRAGTERTPDDLVELGVVRGAYGLRGWVRIARYAADGSVLESVPRWWLTGRGLPQRLVIEGAKRSGEALVAKWRGCDVKEAADALKGAVVAVARSDFPPLAPGEHYWSDLAGSRVVNRAGRELGRIAGLRTDGKGAQWLEVRVERKGSRQSKAPETMLIPLVEQYVDEVDTDAGLIRVDWQEDW